MSDEVKNEIRQLTRIQRRVLGVLMEKGFTTPDQYPLTMKAATTGCNQKNNRDPLTEYSEDQVADTLEQLRELGLVAEIFTDGGRAARYRHYMRHKFDFSETQFAIIAELLLRGRQQPGELRTRASRMVRIDNQEHLKTDLLSLQQKGFVQANGPLDRRGVEVDHTFYLPKEGQTMSPVSAGAGEATSVATEVTSSPAVGGSAQKSAVSPSPVNVVTTAVASPAAASTVPADVLRVMTDRISELTSDVEKLTATVDSLQQRLEKIERELGV